MKNKAQLTKGFTLIELMVSVSIFAIVMTISIGAVLSILDTSKKAQSLKSVMNNLNYSLENMTRTLKTSREFYSIGGSCSYIDGESNSIEIVDSQGDSIRYELNESGELTITGKGFSNTPITAEEIEIQYVCFNVEGSAEGDGIQPKVRIVIKGQAGTKEKTRSNFELQTTVSKRVIQS